jgi:hypothetical protein
MKRIALILAMVISVLFCFAHLGFCADLIMIGYSGSTLVGITSANPNNQFVSINFSTGVLTSLNSNVGNVSMGFAAGGSCVAGSTFYAIRYRSGNCYVISINTSTGALTESPALCF